ncbi:poly(A) polymerase [Actinobacillus delphinicola]|uniref:Poly(A) polymerase I n=2 Tax=Actinobacillus delphinicola TaxID=51161 RepID=A0A448TVA8_9PAST|nr:poly(A) polymerase [Actinobacillus delphinicola]
MLFLASSWEQIIFTFIKKFWTKKSDATHAQKDEVNISVSPNEMEQKPRHNQRSKSAHIHDARQYGIYPDKIHKHALQIVDKLQANGFEAYIVGGCLRDILQNKKPKDFDVATNARPEQIRHIFQRQCRLVGKRFRLAHIMFGRDFIEVATFRADHQPKHNDNQSRQSASGMLLRDNVYGNMSQDAARRDFTVNSFYYDPNKHKLYDFFNGLEDLRNGKLRLIGNPEIRYQEDPVRMLRAIRFMAKLDMFLDSPSETPIRRLAHLLQDIPPARLYDESLKLLQSGHGVKSYRLMRKYGLFEQLFPSLMPFFTERGDNDTQHMIERALSSTDERIADNLAINPAFLFATFFWYPLREKVEILKNEGGLNNHDAYNLASNDILDTFCKRLAAPRRHTSVIRDIWILQLQLMKRQGKAPTRTFEHPKFRAAYDLLAMRAEIEGGESIELATWWYEYQQSNESQRTQLLQRQQRSKGKAHSGEKKPFRRRRHSQRRKSATNKPNKQVN